MSKDTPIKVAIVGATGNTGSSIVNGLLASETTKFELTALARASSLSSPANQSLRDRGVRVVAADLTTGGDRAALVGVLRGVDVVVSCIVYTALRDQVPLAEAAKEAGVGRIVPCEFGPPMPRGVMRMADIKYDILDAIQRIYLPYTVIQVGWWAEQGVASFPFASGRLDRWLGSERTRRTLPAPQFFAEVPGDGEVPVAFTSIADIGLYVARIIADPRTLNAKVLAYTEAKTMNQIGDMADALLGGGGEKAIRNYVPASELQRRIREAAAAMEDGTPDYHLLAERNPDGIPAFEARTLNEYRLSWGVRGDDTPEAARYLGYLDFKELYPGVVGRTIEDIYRGEVMID